MLLSLLQWSKINVFVLTALRITDYGNYRNAGWRIQRTAYGTRIICTGLFVGYCAMAVCGTMVCQSSVYVPVC
jgi:hypothetical protein